MSARAAALPEGGDEALVLRMLERDEFKAMVAAAEARLAEPPETWRRRLLLLARQGLERALLETDPGAILFVLEEEANGRDPAASLVEGVARKRERALRQEAPPTAERRPAQAHDGYAPGYHPLRAIMQGGA